MRVIGGEFRSRRLKSPEGRAVRPTPDRLREALFNVLAPVISPETVFVDCYAGGGSVGIEPLSRGASRAVFIERTRQAVKVLQENLRSLGLEGRARVIHGGTATYLAGQRGNIYFVDPPYELDKEYERALEILGGMAPELVIVQHSSKRVLPAAVGGLTRYRIVKQGDNSLSFYRPAQEPRPAND
jgi:16S rRNA (guanine(966)-N(2))-methyltransferase RsmD